MELKSLGFADPEIKKLNKKGFSSVEDIQMFLPRKYYDFTGQAKLSPEFSGRHVVIIGKFEKMDTDKTNNVLMLKAKVIDELTGKKLNILWIGSYYLKDIIKNWLGDRVIAAGKMTYNEDYHSFHMSNPIIFSDNIAANQTVLPIYTKMSGISAEWMDRAVKKALDAPVEEKLPSDVRERYRLMDAKEALIALHKPASIDRLQAAQKRLIFEKLYTFACGIEEEERKISKGSPFNIKSLTETARFVEQLPFELTASQKETFNAMKDMAADGRRINALIQGDVGSGKTMCAFLMMCAMAGSGYQSVLMAPTEVLARQHYDNLVKRTEGLGFTAVYLASGLSAKERKATLSRVSSGEADLIVGTHSVISDSIKFKMLGLVVIDEEHKFGVGQEEKLLTKAMPGAHVIHMSATPIPRTIANAIYGSSTQVYDLEKPGDRQEIQTAISCNDRSIFKFIEKQIADGRQVYVVCARIDRDDEEGKSSKLYSVEQTLEAYKKHFGKDIRIEAVTGRTPKEEAEQVLDGFKKGLVDILISTTVIEVGVDNPNASVIVINNAERFGISQLHQLRGRVGRGRYKGYCILRTDDRANERLKMLCETTDGFKLAEMDTALRGPGDILGERQSGNSKELELVLKYPKMYETAKREAKASLDGAI